MTYTVSSGMSNSSVPYQALKKILDLSKKKITKYDEDKGLLL